MFMKPHMNRLAVLSHHTMSLGPEHIREHQEMIGVFSALIGYSQTIWTMTNQTLLELPLDTEFQAEAFVNVTWETELRQGYEVNVLRYAEVIWDDDCWFIDFAWIADGWNRSVPLLKRASPLGSAEGRSVILNNTVTGTLLRHKRWSVNLQHLRLHQKLFVFTLQPNNMNKDNILHIYAFIIIIDDDC